jgi:pimeloyl-ACP methyl ester carboxylesterase
MPLPAKGPWPHPYFDLESAHVVVRFEDAEGGAREVRAHHKVTGDGPTAVVVHGLMTTSYSWRYVLAPLGRRYRVFAPDLVGAGASDKPLDFVYSVDNVARFLRAYVREVAREPVYLVGNSLGGLYCVRALMEEPAIARRFVLIHSPGYPMAKARLMNALLRVAPLRRLVESVSHRRRRWFVARNQHYHRADMLSEELVDEYSRLFDTPEGARVFVRILRESVDQTEHRAIIAELRARKARGERFPVPTLLLFATKDAVVPPEFGPLWQRDLPGATLKWMKDTSHFLQCDSPEETVRELFEFDAC